MSGGSPFQVQEHIERKSSDICRHGDMPGWGRWSHRCCSQGKQDVGGHTVHLYQWQRRTVRGRGQQHSTERRKAHPVGRWSAPCCFYVWKVSINLRVSLFSSSKLCAFSMFGYDMPPSLLPTSFAGCHVNVFERTETLHLQSQKVNFK